MKEKEVLSKLKELVDISSSILILAHESPDGDAIGSSLAMYTALKSINKNVDIILDEYSKVFNFLFNIDKVNIVNNEKYDLVIVLDCASLPRTYDPYNFIETATNTFSIDHHKSNTLFCKYNYVDGNNPAASQMLVKIFKYLNIELTKEICEALITGIITDTGGFRYQVVNSDTFDFASYILKMGVNISDIYIKVFQTITVPQFKLQQIALNRLELLYDNKVAFTYILLNDELECNAKKGDHEGIVNVGQSIEGVEVSVFLHESEKGFKVSLRSNKYVDVSKIGSIFDGGGHVRAAGCLIDKTLVETKELILKEVIKLL